MSTTTARTTDHDGAPGESLSLLLVPRTNGILCDSISRIVRGNEGQVCQTLTGDVHQIRWMMATAPRSIALLDNPSETLCESLVDVPNRPPIVVMVPAEVRAIALREMLRLCPAAIVSYEASLSELFDAFQAAGQKRLYVGESMRGTTQIEGSRLVVTSSSVLDRLTSRQLEVAKWLANGYTIAEVAEIMELAEKTVESHRYRIMGRLNLGSRVELTRLLVQEGVVSRVYRPRSERETSLPQPSIRTRKPSDTATPASAVTALR